MIRQSEVNCAQVSTRSGRRRTTGLHILSVTALVAMSLVAPVGAASAATSPNCAKDPAPGDKYPCFAVLAAHEEGHYSIHPRDNSSTAAAIAIHGGHIETYTDRLAFDLAGHGTPTDYYVFEGDSHDEHLTSTRFDEPQAVKLVKKESKVVSLHGKKDDPTGDYYKNEPCRIYVGGANGDLRVKVLGSLKKANFEVIDAVQEGKDRFAGKESSNIVNLPEGSPHGVQLEMPLTLRKLMYNGKKQCTVTEDGKVKKFNAEENAFLTAVRSGMGM